MIKRVLKKFAKWLISTGKEDNGRYAALNMDTDEVLFRGSREEVKHYLSQLRKEIEDDDSVWYSTVCVELKGDGENEEVKRVLLWD